MHNEKALYVLLGIGVTIVMLLIKGIAWVIHTILMHIIGVV